MHFWDFVSRIFLTMTAPKRPQSHITPPLGLAYLGLLTLYVYIAFFLVNLIAQGHCPGILFSGPMMDCMGQPRSSLRSENFIGRYYTLIF